MFTYNDDSWKSSASIYSPENNELEESGYWLSEHHRDVMEITF